MMSTGYSLRSRVPGQSVMRIVVERQRRAPARTRLQRLLGISPIATDAVLPYRAAVAEYLVGRTLDELGSEWDVLHNVPIDSSDGHTYEIDHLAIGPTGVFSVLAKNFPGQDVVVSADSVTVGGKPDMHLDYARAEAEIVGELLSFAAGRPVEVHPLVVLLDPRKLEVRSQPVDATVVSSRQLCRWITRLPRRLDGVAVARISDVADREITWQTAETTDSGTDTDALTAEFVAVKATVDAALRVRWTWLITSIAIVAIGTWAAVSFFVVDAIR